ncbi:MAG TPA: APC family permease [Polyangiaceae bacterium]|nr:APC family permease [Polyangiaceae bacterium]
MPSRLRRLLFGAPKDVHDHKVFHSISLVAMLAWVGLGADGLSSSAYGPDEAFRALVKGGSAHASLAVGLALGTAITVFIISYAYSRIIEHFPSGGGGYVVATKLLGPRFGVASGSALLVDYVLTITTSIASGGDAIFSMIPRQWVGGAGTAAADVGTWLDPVQRTKVTVEIAAIVALTVLNIRGVKESVTAILPIFLAFVATHVVLLLVTFLGHVGDVGSVVQETHANLGQTIASLGVMGSIALFVRAYSLGGGTYTGIEAVSNGVPIMRDPKVRTAKRTMMLMATSLAITAGGIILAYLLVHAMPEEGQTMNAVLLKKVAGGWKLGGWNAGYWFVLIALVSEAGLLFIAAQAGFVDGPRVMANMAIDSWLPHRFAALSERLSMQNGVTLMGATSIAALVYTHGDVSKLVVMYSINVFVTFSMSNLGMSRFWIKERKKQPEWKKHLPIHLVGLALCVTILVVTCVEKFGEGGWLTLVITGALVGVCFWVKRHYKQVVVAIRALDAELPDPLTDPAARALYPIEERHDGDLDPTKPIAILFVGGYGGLGRHALMTLMRMFPGHFEGVVFCSVAILDSGNFKGAGEVTELEKRTGAELDKYVEFARTIGLPADRAFATGTEVAVEAENLGRELSKKYPRSLFVAGQLLFSEDTSSSRLLHNETAFQIQRRLQHMGIAMIVLPVRLNIKGGPRVPEPSRPSVPQIAT